MQLLGINFGRNLPKPHSKGVLLRSISLPYDNKPASVLSIRLGQPALTYCDGIWELFDSTNKNSGQVTSAAYSPDFQKVVALGMISSNTLKLGQNLYTVIHGKKYQVQVEDQPFI